MRCAKSNLSLVIRVTSAALLVTVAHAAAQNRDAMAPFGWLRDLAGACWASEQADGTPIEIHGDTRPKLRGDSVWSWDAAKQRIALVSWATIGPINSSEAYFDGDLVRFPIARRDGSLPEMRRTWRRVDADSFVVTVERNSDGDWRETQSVLYRRVR